LEELLGSLTGVSSIGWGWIIAEPLPPLLATPTGGAAGPIVRPTSPSTIQFPIYLTHDRVDISTGQPGSRVSILQTSFIASKTKVVLTPVDNNTAAQNLFQSDEMISNVDTGNSI